MNTFKKFTCSECGGIVEMSCGVGRTRQYSRGYRVPIPDDFLIPTCGRCGDIYVLPEFEGELNAVLEKQFLKMQAQHYRELISTLTRCHGVKQHDIVRACGVTPAYLSHVLNGKRKASTTLTRLLEAFVACDSEFVRHLKGQHWLSRKARLYAITVPKIQESAKQAAWSTEDNHSVTTQWASTEQDKTFASGPLDHAA